MAQCNMCGKKGLFLRINQFGRCNTCQEQVELIELNKKMKFAEDCYSTIVDMFSIITSSIHLSPNPIERVNEVFLIDEKLETCDKLSSEINRYKSVPLFDKILLNHVEYNDDFSKRCKFGELKDLSIHIWTNHENFLDEAFIDIQRAINKYANSYQILKRNIYKFAEFEKTISCLKQHPIVYSTDKISKFNTTDLYDIKFSSITSKSNYEKLGTFVVIDTETTGLSATKNEIIEVAAVLFSYWEPQLAFTTLIKPKKNLSEEIINLTGITPSMLENAPTISEVVPALTDFIASYPIVGHNLAFDMKFLYRNGVNFLSQKHKYYDTLELSKKILKVPKKKWDKELECYDIDYDSDYDVEDHKLTTLCDYYNIRDNSSAHRAVSDCVATGYLLQNLVKEKVSVF